MVGILHDAASVPNPPFTVQITDVAAKWKWFSQPIPDTLLQKNEGIPNFLHRPYPMTDPGLLAVEIWSQANSTNNSITLAVAERMPQ